MIEYGTSCLFTPVAQSLTTVYRTLVDNTRVIKNVGKPVKP